jgi:hypothetical protein
VDGLQPHKPHDIVRLAITSPAANRKAIEQALCQFGETKCERPQPDGDFTVIECTVRRPFGASLDFVTVIRSVQGVTNVEILGSEPFVEE